MPARICSGASNLSDMPSPFTVTSTASGKVAATSSLSNTSSKRQVPSGMAADGRAHLALGVVHQRRAGRQHRLGAVFRGQRLEAFHADPVGRHLRAQVGQPFARHLAVQQDQVLDIPLQLAAAVETHRRDAQPLLVDVGVAAVDEVGMVREVHRPGDQAAVDEDRFGDDDVGQVRAAALIGVVADEGVARPYVLGRIAPHDVAARGRGSCRDGSGCARPGRASRRPR